MDLLRDFSKKKEDVIVGHRHAFAFHAVWHLAIAVGLFGCISQQEGQSELDAAISSFEIEAGFKIELLAAEPLIGDPVDMEIDEFGRLYVVEMPGYPLDKSGSGKIKLLSDTDGDGLMDKSITFAENLVLPNSIMRWKNGLLVTDAPNVLYLEDTNNDGKAELRDTLLTGFALSNPQHNLNSPLLGIDNWIYLAHEGAVSTETYKAVFGDTGEEIYYPDRPDAQRLAKNANGRSVRFQPDQFKLELLSSHTQFGHTFDDWGNYFLVGNANHIYQEIIPARYGERNQYLSLSSTTQSLSDHGNAAEVFPIAENPQHQLLTDIGVITSACGLTAYLGGAFPPLYNDNITFVAEPVSNLIHVDKLVDNGATFKASRMKPHQEFLASRDAKFRPVNMYIGPDGALYVVDYYRQIIEHPEWMGKEVVESGELYNDMDKGRIYRISSETAEPVRWTKGLTLGHASDEELVAYLKHPNVWWRQNAQRLLIDRKNEASIGHLVNMLNDAHPMGRLHALWTLEGLDQLKVHHIEQALRDSEPGIRVHAIKLAELHLKESPALIKGLLELKPDEDAKVRFQLLCTLGGVDTRGAEEARQHLVFQNIEDPWVQVAALTSSNDLSPLLNVVIQKIHDGTPALTSLIEQLATLTTAKEQNGGVERLMRYALDAINKQHPNLQAALLDGLAKGLANNNKTALSNAQQEMLLHLFFKTSSTGVRKSITHALTATGKKNVPLFSKGGEQAIAIALDRNQPESLRADAVDLLAIQNRERYLNHFTALFVPQEPLPVQLAALRAWSAIPNTSLAEYLANNWSSLTPQVQDAAINTFLNNNERVNILLTAIEKNKIPAASVSWPRRVRLMAQREESLRNRSRALFQSQNEKHVNESYRQSLHLQGDVKRGKTVYQQHCALCHQIRGASGVSIGPDLGTIHNWSAEAIMTNILSPNASISSGYDLWTAELRDGETIQGVIASETPAAITFRNVGSNDKTIHRNEIKSLRALNMSIMPVALEKDITEREMVDLLAFLKENK